MISFMKPTEVRRFWHSGVSDEQNRLSNLHQDWVKIGCSEDVVRRWRQLEEHYLQRLGILGQMPGGLVEERELHERFRKLRIGSTERFRFAPELKEFVAARFPDGPDASLVKAMGKGHYRVAVNLLLDLDTHEDISELCFREGFGTGSNTLVRFLQERIKGLAEEYRKTEGYRATRARYAHARPGESSGDYLELGPADGAAEPGPQGTS